MYHSGDWDIKLCFVSTNCLWRMDYSQQILTCNFLSLSRFRCWSFCFSSSASFCFFVCLSLPSGCFFFDDGFIRAFSCNSSNDFSSSPELAEDSVVAKLRLRLRFAATLVFFLGTLSKPDRDGDQGFFPSSFFMKGELVWPLVWPVLGNRVLSRPMTYCRKCLGEYAFSWSCKLRETVKCLEI